MPLRNAVDVGYKQNQLCCKNTNASKNNYHDLYVKMQPTASRVKHMFYINTHSKMSIELLLHCICSFEYLLYCKSLKKSKNLIKLVFGKSSNCSNSSMSYYQLFSNFFPRILACELRLSVRLLRMCGYNRASAERSNPPL